MLLVPFLMWSPLAWSQVAEMVQVDPLQCWRKIGSNAIHVGEHVDMLLTCSVVDTDTARAVIDPSWLEPQTLTVSPFEILEGERFGDIVRGSRRFIQYRYLIRLIGEEYFGLDVELPPLEVKYRIERTLVSGVAVEGRELTHVLPPESLRVLALVPVAASDIRELPGETFGDAEARLFRARAASIVATIFAILSAVLLLVALVHVGRERWRKLPSAEYLTSPWQVARTALAEMTAVRLASQNEGWSEKLISRGLVLFRIAGALALDTPIVSLSSGKQQNVTDKDIRLPVRRWLFGKTQAFLSSAITVRRIENSLPSIRSKQPGDIHLIESIRDGISAFSARRYGTGGAGTDVLTSQIDTGIAVLRILTMRNLPPVRFVIRLRRAINEWVTAW